MPVSLRREGDENDVRFLVLGGLGVVVREGEADAVEARGPVATVDPFQVVEVLQAPVERFDHLHVILSGVVPVGCVVLLSGFAHSLWGADQVALARLAKK